MITRETVLKLTPDAAATSFMVGGAWEDMPPSMAHGCARTSAVHIRQHRGVRLAQQVGMFPDATRAAGQTSAPARSIVVKGTTLVLLTSLKTRYRPIANGNPM